MVPAAGENRVARGVRHARPGPTARLGVRRVAGNGDPKPKPGSSPPEEGKNVWDLVVFAVIGLFAGAAARLWYPGRQPMRVMGTMLLGMVGSLLGGLLSWTLWRAAEDQLYSGALLMS